MIKLIKVNMINIIKVFKVIKRKHFHFDHIIKVILLFYSQFDQSYHSDQNYSVSKSNYKNVQLDL